jgi:diguanylate cyclase (GGDEF)-like protein
VKIRANRARKLKQVAERDGLTGLLDHVRFKERLNAEIMRSQRSATPFSLCLIDIDHLKRVNDTHGHQAGDRVIQTLGHSLTGALRRSDVIARYGGEEFAVILLDTEIDAAATVINRIREAFSLLDFHAGEASFSCTISAGIAAVHKSDTTEAIIGRADQALYSAKHEGRDRVECEQEPKRRSVLKPVTHKAS